MHHSAPHIAILIFLKHSITIWYSIAVLIYCHININRRSLLYSYIASLYVTVFWKTDRMDTNTEVHFLPVDESHTHALFRNTKHLRLDGRVCFYRRLFFDAVKPRGCLSWPLWPLRGINKTAWGAKLIMTAGLAYPMSCAGLGHLLMANLCPLSLNVLQFYI